MLYYASLALVLLAACRGSKDGGRDDIADISPAHAMAEAKPIVTAQDTTLFVVAIKELELSLPFKVKDMIVSSSKDNVEFAGTGLFAVEYKTLNPEAGLSEVKQLDVDIQTTGYKCNADDRLRTLRTNFGGIDESLNHYLEVDEYSGESFDGFIFRAEDHRHTDKNILIGASNRVNGDCYTTSIALYGADNLNPPAVRRVVKFIADAIKHSYEPLAGTASN